MQFKYLEKILEQITSRYCIASGFKKRKESCIVRSGFQVKSERLQGINYLTSCRNHIDSNNRESRKKIEVQWPFGTIHPSINEKFSGKQSQAHRNLSVVTQVCGITKDKLRCWSKVHPKIWGVQFSEIISHSGPHHKFWKCSNSPILWQMYTIVLEHFAAKNTS